MPNNPLTQQELYDYGILRILTPPTPVGTVPSAPYFPPGYFLVPPHDVDGLVAWRKFHAGYITEGLIDPDRLGTGSLGAGNLYLADDGTWKGITISTPNLQQVTDVGNTTTNLIETNGVKSDYFLLDTTATPTPQTGMMFWDQDTQTPDIQLDSQLAGRVFQDEFWYVKNQTGSQINKGTVVRAVGTLGASSRILVAPMVADGSVPAKFILGIAAENIPNGGDGSVMRVGKIRQINTSMFSAGDVLYANPASPGGLIATLPQAPNLKLAVAFVVHAANNGVLAVRVEVGSDLYEDHRVQVTSPTDGQLLRYDNTDQRWENWTPNFLTTVPTLDQVTTAGNTTTNAITVGNITLNSSTNELKIFDVTGGNYTRVKDRVIYFSRNTGTSESVFISGATDNLLNFSARSGVYFLGGANVGENNVIVRNTANTLNQFIIINEGPIQLNPASGNVLIGTTTDAGYKLDVNGTARIQGNLAATGNYIQFGTNSNVGIGSTNNGGTFINNGPALLYASANINNATNLYGHNFYTGPYNATSGTQGVISLTGPSTFNPTSGTAVFNALNLAFTINQTGGANGITRGLYVNPTLTSAVDFRAIHTTAGKIIHQGLTAATQTNQVYYNTTTGELTYGALPVSAAITSTQISNWDTAYGWGNHATAGYLTGTTGYNGIFTVSTNPPGQQNLQIVNGLIVNVF
jgi:hypothetical protein